MKRLVLVGLLTVGTASAQVLEMPELSGPPIQVSIAESSKLGFAKATGRSEASGFHVVTDATASYNGQNRDFHLDLTLLPGPSFELDGQVISLFVGATGRIESEAGDWSLVQDNAGSFSAKAHFHPWSGHLGIFLPLRAESMGVEAFFTLLARCELSETGISCDALRIDFDAIRQEHRSGLLPAPIIFGWAPVQSPPSKGEILDCCFAAFRCCCGTDCEHNACPSSCTTCSPGGCFGCQSFVGCGACPGCN